METKKTTEEHSVKGDSLVAKIKELIHEGNVTHIVIKNDKGQTLIEIPMTVGLVGAVLLPVWAAIGAIAALAADLTIVVEREEPVVAPREPVEATRS